MRRRLTWGLVVPLVVAGSQAAHAVAYALVYPQASVRGLQLASTGHGYLTWLPLALALGGAVALVSLVSAAADAARLRPAREVPALAFAFLPAATFALQEILELSVHTGQFGWRAVLAPTFLPGLALQLPFGLAAYALARVLLRAAERIGVALAPRPLATITARPHWFVASSLLVARIVRAAGAPRAPPRVAVI